MIIQLLTYVQETLQRLESEKRELKKMMDEIHSVSGFHPPKKVEKCSAVRRLDYCDAFTLNRKD